jgi:hypothetical protein
MRPLRGLVFLVPLLYLGLIFALQPDDYLGEPPGLGRAVYDDYDVAAYALRGLNAHLGRTPGRHDEPRWMPNQNEYTAGLDDATRPLADRYFIEYPLTCVTLFQLGYVGQDDLPSLPSALLDGSYHNLVPHWPRTETEQQLWRQFRRATRTHAVVMALCLLVLMAVLAIGYEPGNGGPFWLLVLPGALYFSLNRFDVLPALLTALSLACLGRGRWTFSAAFLALATAIKVYPLLLAPLMCRYLWDRRQNVIAWAAVYGTVLVLIQVPPLLAWDGQAVWMPYHFQLNRSPEGLTIYGGLLPMWMAQNEPVAKALRLGMLAGTLGLLLLQPMPSLDNLLRRGAVLLIVFVLLAVFFSPQWILWLAPLLIPLARSRRLLLGLIVGVDLTTYLTFPLIIDGTLGIELETWLGRGIAVLRFVLMFGIAGVLLWDEFARPQAVKSA